MHYQGIAGVTLIFSFPNTNAQTAQGVPSLPAFGPDPLRVTVIMAPSKSSGDNPEFAIALHSAHPPELRS